MSRTIEKMGIAMGLFVAVVAGCGVEEFAAAPEPLPESNARAGAVAATGADVGAGAASGDAAVRDQIRAAAEKAGRVFFDAAGNADVTHFDKRTKETRDASAASRAAWVKPRRPHHRELGEKERFRAARMFSALDGNRDGRLTPAEIATNSRALALFAKLDPARSATFTPSSLAVALAKAKAARRMALMHRLPKGRAVTGVVGAPE